MKLVIAIIRPAKLEELHRALSIIGIERITITEVRGGGVEKGHIEIYREAEYYVEFFPKVKVEIAVNENKVQQTIDIILKIAHTGKLGDGIIFVTNIEQIYNIRTKEFGNDSLIKGT